VREFKDQFPTSQYKNYEQVKAWNLDVAREVLLAAHVVVTVSDVDIAAALFKDDWDLVKRNLRREKK
jgi:hypothetical protein